MYAKRLKCFKQVGPDRIHGIYVKQVKDAIDSLSSFTKEKYLLRAGLNKITVLNSNNEIIAENSNPHKVVETIELMEMDIVLKLLGDNNEVFELTP